MVCSYFGSGHGKGLHDGAGAMLKCAIRKEEVNFESRMKLASAMARSRRNIGHMEKHEKLSYDTFI